MNLTAPTRKKRRNWKQIILVSVAVLTVGYTLAQPKLEKWFGRELPTLNAGHYDRNVADRDNSSASDKSARNSDYSIDPSFGKDSSQSSNSGSSATSEDDFFASVKGSRKTSPAGLLYTPGSGGEHRVDHVMRHARDDLGKPSHGVFNGSRLEILELLDEAYEQTKTPGNAKHSKSRNFDEWVVDMGRTVGYEGGTNGKRKGNPDVRKIKMVLDDGYRVITAFPYR